MPFSRTFQAWKSQHCNSRTFQGLYEPCLFNLCAWQCFCTTSLQALIYLKLVIRYITDHTESKQLTKVTLHTIKSIDIYNAHIESVNTVLYKPSLRYCNPNVTGPCSRMTPVCQAMTGYDGLLQSKSLLATTPTTCNNSALDSGCRNVYLYCRQWALFKSLSMKYSCNINMPTSLYL